MSIIIHYGQILCFYGNIKPNLKSKKVQPRFLLPGNKFVDSFFEPGKEESNHDPNIR